MPRDPYPGPFDSVEPTARERALEECQTICRDVMRDEDAGARAETPDEQKDIVRFALRSLRYHTAKQILERIIALPSS